MTSEDASSGPSGSGTSTPSDPPPGGVSRNGAQPRGAPQGGPSPGGTSPGAASSDAPPPAGASSADPPPAGALPSDASSDAPPPTGTLPSGASSDGASSGDPPPGDALPGGASSGGSPAGESPGDDSPGPAGGRSAAGGLPPLGPPRRSAGPSWAVVVLLVAIGLGAGFVMKAPCLATYPTSGGAVALDWRDGRQYTYLCYSDTIPLYGLERLSEGNFPYKTSWLDDDGVTQRYMEYPVLTGLLQYVVMRTTKAWVSVTDDAERPNPPEVVVYFVIMAIVLALAWLAAVLATVPLLTRQRTIGVALLTVSPLVIVHVFTNFDALAVALAAGGLLAWTRRRHTLAGVLLGLGAAAKLYPLFFLGPLLFLGIRTGRLEGWVRATVAAVGAWLAVNAPIAVLYPEGWREFYRLNSTRPADHDTVYFAFRVLFGWQGFDGPLPAGEPPRVLNAVTLLLFALVCAAVAAIALTAPRRPRVASLTFLVVAGFLLTNKVWSPQYSLWLVPLAVLAISRWKILLAWMAVDAAVWYPRMQYFLNFDEQWTKTFVSAVLVRDVVVLGLCAIVVRDIYRPDRDPIRRDGEDDPCGGVYDGALDAPLSWLIPRRKPRAAVP